MVTNLFAILFVKSLISCLKINCNQHNSPIITNWELCSRSVTIQLSIELIVVAALCQPLWNNSRKSIFIKINILFWQGFIHRWTLFVTEIIPIVLHSFKIEAMLNMTTWPFSRHSTLIKTFVFSIYNYSIPESWTSWTC